MLNIRLSIYNWLEIKVLFQIWNAPGPQSRKINLKLALFTQLYPQLHL